MGSTSTVDPFRALLLNLDTQLSARETKLLAFLAHCEGPAVRPEEANSSLQLFTHLEKLCKISKNDVSYLRELFSIIGMGELVEMVESASCEGASSSLERGEPVSSFRVLLYKVCEDLDDENIQRLRYWYNVPSGKVITDGIDLMVYLIKYRSLSARTVLSLVQPLQTIQRSDLARGIANYADIVNNCTQESPNFEKAEIVQELLEFWPNAPKREERPRGVDSVVSIRRVQNPPTSMDITDADGNPVPSMFIRDSSSSSSGSCDYLYSSDFESEDSEDDTVATEDHPRWQLLVEDSAEQDKLTDIIEELRDTMGTAGLELKRMQDRLVQFGTTLDDLVLNTERNIHASVREKLREYEKAGDRSDKLLKETVEEYMKDKIVPQLQTLREDISNVWILSSSGLRHGIQTSNPTRQPSPTHEAGENATISAEVPTMKSMPNIPDSQAKENIRDSQAKENIPDSQAKENILDSQAKENIPDSQVKENIPDSQAKEKQVAPNPTLSQAPPALRPKTTSTAGKTPQLSDYARRLPPHHERSTTTLSQNSLQIQRAVSASGDNILSKTTVQRLRQIREQRKVLESPSSGISSQTSDSLGGTTGIPRLDMQRRQRMCIQNSRSSSTLSSRQSSLQSLNQWNDDCYVLTHLSFIHVLLNCGKKFSGSTYVKELGCDLQAFVHSVNQGTCMAIGVQPSAVSKKKWAQRKVEANIRVILLGGFQPDIKLTDVHISDLRQGYRFEKRVEMEKRKKEGYFIGGDMALRFFVRVIN